MAMKSKLAFVYLLLGSVPGYSQEASAEKPGLAALDIKASHGVPPELAQLMGEILLSELKSSGQFGSVLGSSDMQAMLDLEQQKTALGCDEDSCLAQLGGALGVPYLLTASLGKLGSSFVVTIKIIEVDAAEVKVRAVENAANEEHLRPVVTYLVALANAELFGGAKPEKSALTAVAPSVGSTSAGEAWKKTARFGGFGLMAGGVGFAVVAHLSINSLTAEKEDLEGRNARSTTQARRVIAITVDEIPAAETNRTLGIAATTLGLVFAASSYLF